MGLELRVTGPNAPREKSTPGDRELAPWISMRLPGVGWMHSMLVADRCCATMPLLYRVTDGYDMDPRPRWAHAEIPGLLRYLARFEESWTGRTFPAVRIFVLPDDTPEEALLEARMLYRDGSPQPSYGGDHCGWALFVEEDATLRIVTTDGASLVARAVFGRDDGVMSDGGRSLAFRAGAVTLAHAAEGIFLEPLPRLATTLDAFKKLSALAIETASGLEIST